jgi:two-component system chemotaxis response regulator CheY
MKSDTHFLIVDDYTNIRNLVKTQLASFGFENITEQESADNAMEFLKGNIGTPEQVEFIISDWNMPGSTGLDLLKFVREQAPLKEVPFLILTTENEQAKIMSAIQSGVSNFLLKPWETEELGEKLQLCWKKHNG